MNDIRLYCYHVAGLKILCKIPFPLSIQQEAEEFLHPLKGDEEALSFIPDLTFFFEAVEILPPIEQEAHFTQDRYYVETKAGLTVYHCPSAEQPPYACVAWRLADCSVICRYLYGSEGRMCYSRNISDLLGMETLLLRFNGLILHSSFIRWNKHGILFSAPSGTGKSTQADLWVKQEKAEILNGDRAGLRRRADGWQAYGLPYAGSSGIYRNEETSLSMLVILRQAKENKIRRLSPAEAIRCLYPETLIHRWSRNDVEKSISLLSMLATEIPVFRLECRPDVESVQVLKQALLNLYQGGV